MLYQHRDLAFVWCTGWNFASNICSDVQELTKNFEIYINIRSAILDNLLIIFWCLSGTSKFE